MTPHPKPSPKAKKPGRAIPKRAKAARTPKAPVVARKPAKAVLTKPAPAEGHTKTDMLVAMLKTPGGATSKEMEAATGWAPHSVRGLLGTLRKRGIAVTSTKLPKEPTIYRIPTSKGKPEGDAVGDVL